jgi:hypothetical protein
MISRLVTTAALLAGTALFCLPAQAQTGTSAQSTVDSGGASPTGSVGTTSNTPRDNSSPTSTTMGPTGGGTTNSPGMSSQNTMGTGATGTGTTSSTGGSDSMGTTGTMSGTSDMGTGSMGTGSMGTQADGTMHHRRHDQAQAQPRSHRMRSGNMAERQMTDCLNNAAAQQQPLDSCQR